jgi:hypothetical protein
MHPAVDFWNESAFTRESRPARRGIFKTQQARERGTHPRTQPATRCLSFDRDLDVHSWRSLALRPDKRAPGTNQESATVTKSCAPKTGSNWEGWYADDITGPDKVAVYSRLCLKTVI